MLRNVLMSNWVLLFSLFLSLEKCPISHFNKFLPLNSVLLPKPLFHFGIVWFNFAVEHKCFLTNLFSSINISSFGFLLFMSLLQNSSAIFWKIQIKKRLKLTVVMTEIFHVWMLPSNPDCRHKSNQNDKNHQGHQWNKPDFL